MPVTHQYLCHLLLCIRSLIRYFTMPRHGITYHYIITEADTNYSEAEHQWSTTEVPEEYQLYETQWNVKAYWRPPRQNVQSSHWRGIGLHRPIWSGCPSWLTVQHPSMDQQSSTLEFSRKAGPVYLKTLSQLHPLQDYQTIIERLILHCKTFHPSLQDHLINYTVKQCNNQQKWLLEKMVQVLSPHS